MPGLFSRLKHKDGKSKKKGATADSFDQQPSKPAWTDAWTRTIVEPEEIHELVKRCTEEIKNRGTTMPQCILQRQLATSPCNLPVVAGCVGLRLCNPVLHTLKPSVTLHKLTSCITAQLSTTHSYCCPSDRPPIPALFVPLYGISSITMRSAAKHWHRSCG